MRFDILSWSYQPDLSPSCPYELIGEYTQKRATQHIIETMDLGLFEYFQIVSPRFSDIPQYFLILSTENQ